MMQEISETSERTGERGKECFMACDTSNIDDIDLLSRTLKVLRDFQCEMNRDYHVQHSQTSPNVNFLESRSLDHKIYELGSLNSAIMDNEINLDMRRIPKSYTIDSKVSLTASSLFEMYSKKTSEKTFILLHPMDIMIKEGSERNLTQLMSDEPNPGTSRLKILIQLYMEKFSSQNAEENQRKSIIDEIMHTLEVCWKSRFILYEKLVNDEVAYGKLLPSEIAAKYVRNLFLTDNSEACQNLGEDNTLALVENSNILSGTCTTAGRSSLKTFAKYSESRILSPDNNSEALLNLEKYRMKDDPTLSFPEHQAAVESLKLKRKKREIMARITRQRSLPQNSTMNSSSLDP
jgi:hypothetical protein